MANRKQLRQYETEMAKMRQQLLEKDKEVAQLKLAVQAQVRAEPTPEFEELLQKITQLEEDNQQLLVQRKTLAQGRESIQKELTRILGQNEDQKR